MPIHNLRIRPKDIVAKPNAASVQALADPTVRKRLSDLAQEIASREPQTTQGFGAFQSVEIEKWRPIIRAADIKSK